MKKEEELVMICEFFASLNFELKLQQAPREFMEIIFFGGWLT